MNPIRLITTLVLIQLSTVMLAQNTNFKIVFNYDNAGNRILKEVKTILLKQGDTLPDKPYLEPETDLLDKMQVTIFPNPTHANLIVEIKSNNEHIVGQITLASTDGKILISNYALKSHNVIDLSKYPSGIYHLKLIHKEHWLDWKIVKQ